MTVPPFINDHQNDDIFKSIIRVSKHTILLALVGQDMCYCICNMFKSLTWLEIQALCICIKKKNIKKIWHNKKKKTRKFQEY